MNIKIVRRKSQKTFTTKDGKEVPYNNYALVLETGAKIGIRCVNARDQSILFAISESEEN